MDGSAGTARRRVLVLATTAIDEAGAQRVREVAGGTDADVVVVAPSISSAMRYWTQDVSARRDAEARLQASLAALEAVGLHARGEIGDDDPLLALEDACAVHGADAVVLVTPPAGSRGWLEAGLVPAARQRVKVPLEHVVVGGEASPEDEAPFVREHPTRDAALVVVLGVLATFGSIVTFLIISRSVSQDLLLLWAIFGDVAPKVAFAWVGWRLYLRHRHRAAPEPPTVRASRLHDSSRG